VLATELDDINIQWFRFKVHISKQRHLPIDQVFETSPQWEPDIPGMVALVNLMVTFSPECERQLSSMNSLKTSLRNFLGQGLLLISGLYVVVVVITSMATRRKFLAN